MSTTMTIRATNTPKAQPASRSAERQQLAETIFAQNAARATVEAIQSAIRQAGTARADQSAAVTAAKLAIIDAENHAADALVHAAMGTTAPAVMTPAEARTRLADLETKSPHFDTAIRILEQKLGDAKNALPSAADKVIAARNAVLKADPIIRKLFFDFVRVSNERETLWNIVTNLPAADIRPDGVPRVVEPDYRRSRTYFDYADALLTDPDATYSPPTG
jgi:hypothetical protein